MFFRYNLKIIIELTNKYNDVIREVGWKYIDRLR